ncbi:MAG: hypothetical protein Q8Q18_02730 [bacterium]|nr:hypothetical protein [bacterium]
MQPTKLNQQALAYAGALVSATSMLLLGVLYNLGIYTGAALMMQQWHMFFNFTPIGIISGMIEAAIISYLFLYLFAFLYNKRA